MSEQDDRMADSSPGGVEGVQALIEKWRKEAQAARIALGTIGLYRRVPRWEWDAIKHTEQHADELEALLALRPQLTEKKDDLSRVDQSALSEPAGSTAREQPDSSQR